MAQYPLKQPIVPPKTGIFNIGSTVHPSCDTGVISVTGVWVESKGYQATFDNSQQNNLRSCVWVSVVVEVRMFVLISLLTR